jgi:hypothetical protein
MAKRTSYQSIIRDSGYYERLGMQVELERLQKQADDIRLQLARYPARILDRAQISGLGQTASRSGAARDASAQLRTGTRTMSAAARKRISDAQKARWARQRAAGGGQSPAPGASEGDRAAAKRGRSARAGHKRGVKKRTLSAEARKRIADAQKRRWARHRKQKA